jgi:hypothetical protein
VPTRRQPCDRTHDAARRFARRVRHTLWDGSSRGTYDTSVTGLLTMEAENVDSPIVRDTTSKGLFYTSFSQARQDEDKFYNFVRMSSGSMEQERARSLQTALCTACRRQAESANLPPVGEPCCVCFIPSDAVELRAVCHHPYSRVRVPRDS